jgi:hypothetical protein
MRFAYKQMLLAYPNRFQSEAQKRELAKTVAQKMVAKDRDELVAQIMNADA